MEPHDTKTTSSLASLPWRDQHHRRRCKSSIYRARVLPAKVSDVVTHSLAVECLCQVRAAASLISTRVLNNRARRKERDKLRSGAGVEEKRQDQQKWIRRRTSRAGDKREAKRISGDSVMAGIN